MNFIINPWLNDVGHTKNKKKLNHKKYSINNCLFDMPHFIAILHTISNTFSTQLIRRKYKKY